MKIKQDAEPVEPGDPVIVVDEHGRRHIGLVTAVHGHFSAGGGDVPSLDTVHVSDDPADRDQYGRQTTRLASVRHYSQVPQAAPTPARYWANP